MLRLMRKLRGCESGATAIEYGLIAAIVSIVIVGGIHTAANEMINMYDYVSGTIGGTLGN